MKAPRLHIIMACARPWNIPRLAPAYLERMEAHPFEVRWHILLQGPEPDPKGVAKTNEALDQIRDGWVLTLADDTDQHPSLFRRLGEVIATHPQAGAVVFSQDRHRGRHILRPTPATMGPCHVCGGQVAWERQFLGDVRFDWDQHGGCADGHVIQRLHQAHPDRFVFVDEVLMRFGSLEW
jgi:hypothetical protein